MRTIAEIKQYLTFKLGGAVYALDVARVREVLDCTTVTKIPRMPEFMRGVINLRGNVVPVVDLRLGFGLTNTDTTGNACIIVVEVQLEADAMVLGALADSVEEVIELEPEQVEPAPRIGRRIKTDFIRGMVKRESDFILILDIDKVFFGGRLGARRSR